MGCHTSIASIMGDHSGCRCFVEELSHMRKEVTEISDDKTQRINDKHVAWKKLGLLWQIIPHAPGLDKGFMNRFACSPSRSLDWFGKLCRTRFTTSLLHNSFRSTKWTPVWDTATWEDRPSSCYLFHTSDTVKIIILRIEAWEEIRTWHSRKPKKWNQIKGILEKKKNMTTKSTNVWVPSSVFPRVYLDLPILFILATWWVATCKPLLCFAMFSLIPLAHRRWWLWHVMTPCICWFNDFRLF